MTTKFQEEHIRRFRRLQFWTVIWNPRSWGTRRTRLN